jgi:uncharacterized lipoprotein YmbA
MIKHRHFVLRSRLLVMTALLVAGCSSSPSVQYYTLDAVDSAGAGSSELAVGENVAIGIGPVGFPDLLKRPQIVTRSGSNRLHVDEFHRWAGAPDEGFTRALAGDLSTLLATHRVAVFPWGGYFQPTYRVVMNVQRFDGQPGGTVTLDATWTLLDKDAGELAVRRSVIEEQTAGGGYEGLVSAKGRAVGRLGREIAEQIHKVALKVAN